MSEKVCELCGGDAYELESRYHTGWGEVIAACDMCRHDCEFLVAPKEGQR